MKLGTWLLSMMQPLLAKILVSLGFSVVSIVGVDSVINALKDQVIAGVNTLSTDTLNFMLYLWIGKGIGIIFGAITTKVMLWSIQNATSMLGRNSS